MPKILMEFDLPEEQYDYWMCSRASVNYCALHEIDQHCRSVYKYGHKYKSVEDLAEAIREMVPCLEEE